MRAGMDAEAVKLVRSFNGPREDGPTELTAFLAREVPEYDWIVPGLLERGDRLILTGGEGKGKSTALRQWAVQLASGLHPFGGEPFEPLRVLLVDLENSARHIHRKLRPLAAVAGDAYVGGLMLSVRPAGLDLLRSDDVGWLTDQVEAARPDVLITGPLYKLAAGDPTEEGTVRRVTAVLDGLRAAHQCALLLEAHSPHQNGQGRRPTRPYGASLWMRWPEFGVFLDGDTGALEHWRGQRDERDWPAALERGADWPWSPVSRPRDALWARIRDLCVREGGKLSVRDLEARLGSSRSSVQRAISEHHADWEAMA